MPYSYAYRPMSMAMAPCICLQVWPYAYAYDYGVAHHAMPMPIPIALRLCLWPHAYTYGIQWGCGCPDLHNTMPMPMRNTVSSALGADVEPSPRHPSYARNPHPVPISFLLLGPPQLHAHGNG